MNAENGKTEPFKVGERVRWIGEWPYPLVNAPPRLNTIVSLDPDGKISLVGSSGEGEERWRTVPADLVRVS